MAGLQYNRRAFTAGMASLLTSPLCLDLAHAQQIERSSLKLGVANRAHLYYLPVTIADRRGYFRDYGLTVTTSDFEGGGQAFDALLAGSVDVAAGAYEHTLRAQAMGQDVRAVIELGRFPGVVLAVGKDRPFKSIPDLKGRKIGVTAPSSSSQFFVLYLMAKAGLAPGDVSFVGVGGGERAVDAMKTGEIDAISNLDPVITRLQQDGAIRIVVDSRFPRVNYDIFGGTNPAAVLYGKQEFIAANPVTMQALVNAFYKTLRWIATATTDEIVDTVPTEYFLGDRALYVKALKANLLVYSRTGVITRQGMGSALKMMATFDPVERTMQQSVSVAASPELLHAPWWPQGWWRIVDTRIGIVPVPIYVILVALLAGFTYTGDIKGEVSIMIAVLVIGGFTCAEIGKRMPVLRNVGAGAIFATFVPSALAYYKLLPPQIEKSVVEFTKYTNFLYLFIACIIVGSILSMDRKVLVQGFFKIFVPLAIGSIAAGIVGTLVGMLLGLGAFHTFFFVVIPIMAGGVGEGAIPLSAGYAEILGQPQGDMFAQVLPPVMLGSLTAILLAGTLNFVGKRYPALTGEGRLQPGEHDEMDTRRQDAEDETGAPIDVGTVAAAGLTAITLYLLGIMCYRLFGLPAPVAMLFLAVIAKLTHAVSPHLQQGGFVVYKFFSTAVTYPLLFAIGVAMTPWNKLVAAFNVPNLITIVSTVATLMATGALVGRWLNMYPIEAAIINACHSGQGGTGDVAILTAANRMQLMPFAQIATRIGGAITVTLVLILLSRMV